MTSAVDALQSYIQTKHTLHDINHVVDLAFTRQTNVEFWKDIFADYPEVVLAITYREEQLLLDRTIDELKAASGVTALALIRLAAGTLYRTDKNWRELCKTTGHFKRENDVVNDWMRATKAYPRFQFEFEWMTARLNHAAELIANPLRVVAFYTFEIGVAAKMEMGTTLKGIPHPVQLLRDLKAQPLRLGQFVNKHFKYESFYIENQKLYVKFESTKKLDTDEHADAVEYLTAQLKEGWGMTLQQKKYSMGVIDYTLSFDAPIEVSSPIRTEELSL